MKEKNTQVILEKDTPLEAGGLPVMSDGVSAIINTEHELSLIYGGTASKKTRTLIIPLIEILAQARESMIIISSIHPSCLCWSIYPNVRDIRQ